MRLSLILLLGLCVFFAGAVIPVMSAHECQCVAQVPVSKTNQKAETAKYTKYRNDHYNFSFEYPVAWSLQESLDGNGVFLSPAAGGHSRVAMSGSKVPSTETHALSLEEDFDTSLQSMMKTRPHPERHPRNVTLVKKETITFLGLPAILSTIKFDKDGQEWMERGILTHSQDGSTAYHIGFDCHPEELNSFQPAYDKVVQTFRIIGPPM